MSSPTTNSPHPPKTTTLTINTKHPLEATPSPSTIQSHAILLQRNQELLEQTTHLRQEYSSQLRTSQTEIQGQGQAYTLLEQDRNKLMPMVEDLDTELVAQKEQLDEHRKRVVRQDAEISELRSMLAWDRNAGRRRQEIDDLRERIVSYEHALDELMLGRNERGVCERWRREMI